MNIEAWEGEEHFWEGEEEDVKETQKLTNNFGWNGEGKEC